MTSSPRRSGTATIERQPWRRSASRCGSAASAASSGAWRTSPAVAARPMNVSSRPIGISRSASASSALVPKQVRSANSPSAGSYSKIEPPSASDSSTARATIVVRTSSASRLELTAWLISPRARSSSTERASSAPRSCSSRNRRTFEIAIAPWAANVVTSSIVSLAERVDIGAGEDDDADDAPAGEHRDAEQRVEAPELERRLPLVARVGVARPRSGRCAARGRRARRACPGRARSGSRAGARGRRLTRPSRSRGGRRGRRAATPFRSPRRTAERRGGGPCRTPARGRTPTARSSRGCRSSRADARRRSRGPARVGRRARPRRPGLAVSGRRAPCRSGGRGRLPSERTPVRQAFIKSPSAQEAVSGSSLERSSRSWSRSARRFARRTCASRSRRCSSAVSVRSGGTSPTGRPCSSTATIVM